MEKINVITLPRKIIPYNHLTQWFPKCGLKLEALSSNL